MYFELLSSHTLCSSLTDHCSLQTHVFICGNKIHIETFGCSTMFIPRKLLNQIIWTHFVHSGKPQHWTAKYPHVTTTQGCWDFPLESIGVYNQNVNMWSFFVVLWILELVWTLYEFPRVRNTAVLFLLKNRWKKDFKHCQKTFCLIIWPSIWLQSSCPADIWYGECFFWFQHIFSQMVFSVFL